MHKQGFTQRIFIILTIVFIISACTPIAAISGSTSQVSQRAAKPPDFPPDLEVPATLPSIQEPEILEAWVRLYNRPGPIFQWDGSLLTGKSLAQFIVTHSIPVLWDTENKCGSAGACSIRYCVGNSCTYDGDHPGADPIYIALAMRDRPRDLLGTLAHEIYHRLEPFGGVRDTLFEEYCAYAVEIQVSGASLPRFGAYDPLIPEELLQWFKQHKIDEKYPLESYPASIAPLVKDPS